jgi:hypothetical protein
MSRLCWRARGDHRRCVLQRADDIIYSPRTRIAVWPAALGEFIVENDQQCRRASGVPASGERAGADEPASSHGGGSLVALGASDGCISSCKAVLPGRMLCSCSCYVCLCAHLWGWKQRIAREEPRCMCHVRMLCRTERLQPLLTGVVTSKMIVTTQGGVVTYNPHQPLFWG